jgi:hypothetical protein
MTSTAVMTDCKVVGTGNQSVYVYYLPKYATEHATYYWPCKIGMSTGSAIDRVNHQVKTALPEKPIIGLIVKTDDAYLLEQALHAILRLKKRETNAPGKEWFNTTPAEVLCLCETLRMC